MIAPYGGKIAIDLGTGDGLFVYHSARRTPKTFFIGIDANVKPLEKISQKICRKPSKGGVPNALYLRSSIEDLPAELTGLAREIYIHYPWGTLLGAVLGKFSSLDGIKRMCQPDAQIFAIVSFDREKDQAELERLGIQMSNLDLLKTDTAQAYQRAGLKAQIDICTEQPEVQTTWAVRLRSNPNRIYLRLIASKEMQYR